MHSWHKSKSGDKPSTATRYTTPTEDGQKMLPLTRPEAAFGAPADSHRSPPLPDQSEIAIQDNKRRLDGAVDEATNSMSKLQPFHHQVQGVMAAVQPVVQNISSAGDFLEPLIEKIRVFTSVVEKFAEIHPYAKAASTILLSIVKPILAQNDRDAAMQDLYRKMRDVYDVVIEEISREGLDGKRKKIVQCLSEQTVECARFIHDQSKRPNFYKRTVMNTFSGDKIDKTIQNYCKVFDDLKRDFTERTVRKTELISLRILENLKEFDVKLNILTEILLAPEADQMGSLKPYLPGTRRETLDHLIKWINNIHDSNRRVFFLLGGAGMGKSAIAHAIAGHFRKLGRLGAFFRFTRNIKENRQLGLVFSTIAHKLALWEPAFGRELYNCYTPGTLMTMSSEEQWDQLILQPANKLKDAFIGPVVLVIDALDESGTSRHREDLVSFLTEHAAGLPSNFRVIVTSRPEEDIILAIKDNLEATAGMELGSRRDEARGDIQLYIRDWFKREHLEDRDCQILVNKADGLFQWAFTACKFMEELGGGLSLQERLQQFLSVSASSFNGLDNLYSFILSEKFKLDRVKARFISVMAQILGASEPLSCSSLREIRSCATGPESVGDIRLIVQELGALLAGTTDDETPIRPYHTSFRDFLTDEKRSGEWYVDVDAAYPLMILGCFRIMNMGLHFNICSLPSSFLPNREMLRDNKIDHRIPEQLIHACRFWVVYLKDSIPVPGPLIKEIVTFASRNLLFWFEVLSVHRSLSIGARSLAKLSDALTSMEGGEDPEILEVASLLKDAIQFLHYFAPVISLFAPHIYISAIPFCPRESQLAKTYRPRLNENIWLEKGQLIFWPAVKLTLRGHTDPIRSVAFSPDGKQIVSGSEDRTVRIWNVETGRRLHAPLQGHNDHVVSVTFSPDGKKIASGSLDNTIQIWDAQKGKSLGVPLQGHTKHVISVAFSPDGKQIVSGSHDQTIRIWDAETGKTIGVPLQGHANTICSVRFSPDGKQIASGSWDRTIRIWDVNTGETVRTLLGHNGGIYSVAFSPDGKQIASGSHDQTIRIWDVDTGGSLSTPLQGHTGPVNSVAFSPDGKRIASGSIDKTVRIWDVETGETVHGPLEAHTNLAWPVAFSLDGKQVASGSFDGTIRIWDVNMGESLEVPCQGQVCSIYSIAFSPDGGRIASGSSCKIISIWDVDTGETVGTLVGHIGGVSSVAFSPNGKHIASSSSDKTILIWDAETGKTVGAPLQGHTECVGSIAFSPDGKQIVSGSHDQTIRIWDAETGKTIGVPLQGHANTICSVRFSPDGKQIVSGSHDQTIRIWDVNTGETVRTLLGHNVGINSVAFSPDGKQIASGSIDKTVRIWDVDTGETVGTLLGHNGSVRSVAFSPDGKQIASGSLDGTIRIWDVDTGKTVGPPLRGHNNGIRSIAFSPDGKQIASGSWDGTIRIWDVGKLKNHTINTLPEATSDYLTNTSLPPNSRIPFSDLQSVYIMDEWCYTITLEVLTDLLLWIPEANRMGLHTANTSKVIGFQETRLWVDQSLWGENWVRIWRDID